MALFLTAVANILKSNFIQNALRITQVKTFLNFADFGKSIKNTFKSYAEFKKKGKGGWFKFWSKQFLLLIKKIGYDKTKLNHQKTIFYKWAKYQERKYEYWEEVKYGFVPPDIKYDFFLKNYAYKFGLLGKIWREYERLLRKLENEMWKKLREFEYKYNNELYKKGQKKFREEMKWAKEGGMLETLYKKQEQLYKWVEQYFDIVKKENQPLFNYWYQNPSKTDFKRMRHILIREEKLKSNINFLTKDITNFSEWFNTLTDTEKDEISMHLYEYTGSSLMWSSQKNIGGRQAWNSSWINSALFAPLSSVLTPTFDYHFKPFKSELAWAMDKMGTQFLYNTNNPILDKIYTKTWKLNNFQRQKFVVNNKTRGFLHIWIEGKWVIRNGQKVKIPRSSKNPDGHYVWFNVPWRIYKKLDQERTGTAFWKYFYRRHKMSMDYLTNRSIYYDTTRIKEKKYYNNLKRKKKKAKK